MFYFAYGSNMERHHMKRRCRSAKFVAAVTLRDYELNFTGTSSMWGGGVADLSPAKGKVVEGVLWDISEADLKELDEYEGYHKVYVRRNEEHGLSEKDIMNLEAIRPMGKWPVTCD